MTRCSSYYQNINQKGQPIGDPVRCSKPAGHPMGDAWHEQHQHGGRGRRMSWPSSAQMVHPLALELQRKAAQ